MSIRQELTPVCLAAALLSVPAARAAEIAYVRSELTTSATTNVVNVDTFNSTSPVVQESHSFDGLTAIRFGDRWPNLRDGLNFQVSGYRWATGVWGDPTPGQGDCSLASWGALEVEVQCIAGDGPHVSRRFLVLALRPEPAETDRIAFAVLDQPASASYLAEEQRRFGLGTMRVNRSGVGQYSVDLGAVATTETTVQVTALDREAHCNVANWGGGFVNVRCFAIDGTPVDSEVSVLALSRTMPGLSFVWNSSTAGSVSSAYSHASDGGAQAVVRSGVGQYDVTLGPEAALGGHVQVTAYGSNAYCWLAGWADRVAQVRCARGGAFTDSRFTVMALKSQEVLPAQTIGGTAAADALICPSALLEGDREFSGHGPRMTISATVAPSADRRRLVLTVSFSADETAANWSRTRGFATRTLFTAPAGHTVTVLSDSSDTFTFVGSGDPGCCGEQPFWWGFGTGLVSVAEGVGDTGGDDISTDADCSNDTRLQRLSLNPIRFQVD